jgi:uncharacterized Rmd1/YagE family protein
MCGTCGRNPTWVWLVLTAPRASRCPNLPSAFFFNYGTVVFWGISTADEQALMHTVVRPCSVGPLDVSEVEIDSFSYNYSAVEPPHVQVRGLRRGSVYC